MSDTSTTSATTTTAAAAAVADDDDDAAKDRLAADTDAAGAEGRSKAMMEYFRKRCKSGGVTTTADSQNVTACEASSSTDADCTLLASEQATLDVHKEYGYYHTVSSSDARVLRAALAKERVPIFRRSESKSRRSMAGAGMRFAYPKDRITEGEVSQSLSPAKSDTKSFRDIFLRRRNRSERCEPNPDIAAEGKPKSGGVRIRNLFVSFRSRPRSSSVSYTPVEATSSATTTTTTTSSTAVATSVQTVGKKKKFKVTPATLLPSLKRPEPPRVGPEDFVEMYCRSRTTSDPRSDALLKAKVAANLHKVSTCTIAVHLLTLSVTVDTQHCIAVHLLMLSVTVDTQHCIAVHLLMLSMTVDTAALHSGTFARAVNDSGHTALHSGTFAHAVNDGGHSSTA